MFLIFDMGDTRATRRRGEALEAAILDAAWSELQERGFNNFTVEAVAERASTSRPVLYRRWANKADLALAGLRHQLQISDVPLPDTGSARDDLIALLRQSSVRRAALAITLFMQMNEYFSGMRLSPADLKKAIFHDVESRLNTVLMRGVERGEIDETKLTPRIRTLPFDLVRHELVMTLRPVPESAIREIVDSIFLPLVRVDR